MVVEYFTWHSRVLQTSMQSSCADAQTSTLSMSQTVASTFHAAAPRMDQQHRQALNDAENSSSLVLHMANICIRECLEDCEVHTHTA